jgi:hypothetical protein
MFYFNIKNHIYARFHYNSTQTFQGQKLVIPETELGGTFCELQSRLLSVNKN